MIKFCKHCSFTVSGRIYDDQNANCQKETGETWLEEHLVRLDPGPKYTITDQDGNYDFALSPGSYQVTHITPFWFQNSCGQNTESFTLDSLNPHSTVNFGQTSTQSVHDLNIQTVYGAFREVGQPAFICWRQTQGHWIRVP